MEEIVWIGTLVKEIYSQTKLMRSLMPGECAIYNRATICHLCSGPFARVNNWKVRDHDYFTGAFIEVAWNNCNKLRRHPKHLSIPFNNLAYNAHFVKTQLD
ncbi:hypothetical protein PR048_012981 [Dryococelus australis]|uniref:Uncharacterized protein n=1 Tax=Dryococelus australis TaxID=614101 RepID=A0ABQ9HQW0_9NEOP|nr:hypothetical protein PR048_012981 [Dryococelus australis]